MKALATLAVIISVFMQPAFAEKGKRGQHMDRMIEELQLTSEQEPAVRQILTEQHTKMRRTMEDFRAETSQRLSTVLTDEQLQTFNAQMEKHQNKMRERRNRWQNKGGEVLNN